MKRHAIIVLALLAIGSCSEKKAEPVKAPVRVKTQLVSPAFVDGAQTYVGIVEENEATAVSFTGMGVVQHVWVSEGQAVSRGQRIAEMDKTQARNARDGALALLHQAYDARDRYRQLHEAGSLPEVQWVEIESKVAQAESQFQMAQKNVNDCNLTAPVSGIIGRKLVGAGETALPSQAVVTILDISTVKVKVAVPEGEISVISANTPSEITVEAANEVVNGGRIEKGVKADALTHTYDVRISVANKGRKLLPGMVASVRFTPEDSHRVAGKSLPVTAVQKSSDGSLFVWTLAPDSTVHRTKVTVGPTTGNSIAIKDGINMGQRVVTDGYQKLSEGTKVMF